MINIDKIVKEIREAEKKIIKEQSVKYGLDITQFLSASETWPHRLIWDNDKINIYLKKGPFCGGKAEIVEYQDDDDDMSYTIQCTECNAESDEYENRVEAVLKWNQRM